MGRLALISSGWLFLPTPFPVCTHALLKHHYTAAHQSQPTLASHETGSDMKQTLNGLQKGTSYLRRSPTAPTPLCVLNKSIAMGWQLVTCSLKCQVHRYSRSRSSKYICLFEEEVLQLWHQISKFHRALAAPLMVKLPKERCLQTA